MGHFPRKKAIFIPFIAVGALFLISGLVMVLWNGILPAVLGVHVVTYWQGMGLLLLCKILFGFRGGGKPGWGRGRCGPRGMREKFAEMSPEERDKFKEEFKRRSTEWHMGHKWPQPPGDNREADATK